MTTRFTSAIGASEAQATYEEWQLDALGNADMNNSNLEGDDTVAAAIVPTVRAGNRTQILKKPFTVSNTQEAVKKAGRGGEITPAGPRAASRPATPWRRPTARRPRRARRC